MAEGKRKSPTTLSTLDIGMGKLPPQDISLEEQILGVCIGEPVWIDTVTGILQADDFYRTEHHTIYSALLDMVNNMEPVDLTTVVKKLKKIGKLMDVGGPFYISQLTNKIQNTSNIEFHCRILQQYGLQRAMIAKASDIINKCYEDTTDVFDVVDDIGKWYNGIGSGLLVTTQRINAGTMMQKDNELITIDGKRFLSVGNVSGIVAPYGVGKSNVMGAISAGVIDCDCDGLGFRGNLYGKKIFHADTESSHNDGVAHYRRILRRIDYNGRGLKYMNGDDIKGLVFERFKGISECKDRRRAVDRQMRTGKYKIIILDGITDFITDPNNLQESQDVMGWLGATASRYELGIVFTIHDNVAPKHSENKGKARGHIGSEAARKAETLLYLRKSKADDRIREITNDFDFQKMRNDSGKAFSHYMVWSEELGLFVSTDAIQDMDDGKELSDIMRTELFYKSIFISTPRPMSHKELIDAVMEVDGIKERRARDKIVEALTLQIVFKLESGLYYNAPEYIEPPKGIADHRSRQMKVDEEEGAPF